MQPYSCFVRCCNATWVAMHLFRIKLNFHRSLRPSRLARPGQKALAQIYIPLSSADGPYIAGTAILFKRK